MEAILAAIQVWFERSKLPTAVVAITIIFLALWNIWRAIK